MFDSAVWQDVLWISGAITVVLTCVEVIRRVVVKPISSFVRAARFFLEDWNGREARDGHPAVPGIPEQIARMRATQEDLAKKLQRVEYHTGNGQEPALRTLVTQAINQVATNTTEIELLKRRRSPRKES